MFYTKFVSMLKIYLHNFIRLTPVVH